MKVMFPFPLQAGIMGTVWKLLLTSLNTLKQLMVTE